MSTVEGGRYVLEAARSKVRVYSYKAGILAKLAHDLVMEAQDISGEILLEGGRGELTMDIGADSLKVISDNISADDKLEVAANIRKKVLKTARYPTITVASSATFAVGRSQQRVALTLASKRGHESVSVEVTEEEPDTLRVRARFPIQQTHYGIKPFTAMLGALKIKDEIDLEGDLVFVRRD